jgi:hypothetical protein
LTQLAYSINRLDCLVGAWAVRDFGGHAAVRICPQRAEGSFQDGGWLLSRERGARAMG